MEHEFTSQITAVLESAFGEKAGLVFDRSNLLQYLNIKTRSAARSSKSRSNFGNLYAIYVLVEDYLNHQFDEQGGYSSYEGARFTELLKRQRQLPFGSKLQNHALNHRMNEEFHKYFPEVEFIPILRDVQNNRYWFNENLLVVLGGGESFNIAKPIKRILEFYIEAKRESFLHFIKNCERLSVVSDEDDLSASEFIENLLAPNVDARIFEIVSYAILRYYYHDQVVYFGFDINHLQAENLRLYKTGRTNANDGGIDFVMRPIGRFFQVTETLDVKKYFLDIDKVERFPISFVVKSNDEIELIVQHIRDGAKRLYSIDTIIEKYMACIEEVINIPLLKDYFHVAQMQGYLRDVLDEIVLQSKVEFNYSEFSE
jgi:hypothetical protein